MKNEPEVLDSPIWILLINIVALEMLGAKMPKPSGRYIAQGIRINQDHIVGVKQPGNMGKQLLTGTLKRTTHSGSSDEDPYSLTPSGSSGSSGKGLRER